MNQFEDMQTFVRIVEAGSITKAAEQLNTVKSAVSRRLSDLEKRLGLSLLTRTTRSHALTESGQRYYQQCLRIIDDVAEVESSITNDLCALKGRIKIAAPLSFGLTHLAPALRQFNQIHPEINFDLDFNDRKVDLIEEGFDLAIRISKLQDSSLIARKITSGKTVLAASPAYLLKQGHPQIPQDLTQGHVKLRYNLSPDNWVFRDKQTQANSSSNSKTKTKTKNPKHLTIKVPNIITANNGDYLCQEAIEGKGLLYTPDFICYKAIKLGQLTPILTEYLIQDEIPAYAVYPQTRRLSQRVRSLVDYLSVFFGDEPYWRI